MMRGVKAVIFDLDNTIVDESAGLDETHRVVAKRLCNYLREKGVGADESEILPKLKALDDRMNLERRYNRDEWWPSLLAELGVNLRIPPPLLKELTLLHWMTYAEKTRPYPDAWPTLRYLRQRGYKLGLITDTDGTEGIKRMRLQRLELKEIFSAVVISGEDTLKTKPDPAPFLLLAENLGVESGECVVVGDKPFTDIDGGNAAGMRTILLKRKDWGVEEHPDITIKSLAELQAIL